MTAEFHGILLDYSRQRVTPGTMDKLEALARAAGLQGKLGDLARGEHLNSTEDRAVGHMALRAPRGAVCMIDGANVVPAVHGVLDRIATFANAVRIGAHAGATGKKLTNVVSIGIGGSYLGVEFVAEALRCDGQRAPRT